MNERFPSSSRHILDRVLRRNHVRPSSSQPTATPDTDSSTPHLGLPHGERSYTMFVQTARAGTWAPKGGEEGVYTLTLSGLPGQTVYFSDRPSRVTGLQSTPDFLSALGFGADNPPNAALVTTTDGGTTDVLVLELFDQVFDQGDLDATLAYDARILENYSGTRLEGVALEQDDSSIPAEFEGASLFIDDCSDGQINCRRDGKFYGFFSYGCCYSFPGCHQCHDETGICKQLAGCEDGGCTETYAKECLI